MPKFCRYIYLYVHIYMQVAVHESSMVLWFAECSVSHITKLLNRTNYQLEISKVLRTSNKDVINDVINFKLPSEILPARFDRCIFKLKCCNVLGQLPRRLTVLSMFAFLLTELFWISVLFILSLSLLLLYYFATTWWWIKITKETVAKNYDFRC